MSIAVLGIDLGKTSCSVVGLDGFGQVMLRWRRRRETVVAYAAKLPACIVAMEAGFGAHHLTWQMAAQGHEVRLMSPEHVRPYVKAQKNDDQDAEAIAEAATRPTMRFVALKSEERLDMQTLHRVRDRLVAERASLMNQVRSLLLERGIVVPQGRAKLDERLSELRQSPDKSALVSSSCWAICMTGWRRSRPASGPMMPSSRHKRRPTSGHAASWPSRASEP